MQQNQAAVGHGKDDACDSLIQSRTNLPQPRFELAHDRHSDRPTKLDGLQVRTDGTLVVQSISAWSTISRNRFSVDTAIFSRALLACTVRNFKDANHEQAEGAARHSVEEHKARPARRVLDAMSRPQESTIVSRRTPASRGKRSA